jgi:uncharacterized protein (DUF2141 family)
VEPLPGARSSPHALRIALTLCLCASLGILAERAAGQIKGTQPQASSMQSQISGHVYRSDTGEPIAKVQVSLDPQDEKTQQVAGDPRIVRTGPDGAFVFSDLPPGSYRVSVWRNGFANGRGLFSSIATNVSLASGQKLDNLILHLAPAGVIAGTVVDEDHEPLVGITVYILSVEFARGGSRRFDLTSLTTTDDQGNYRAPALPPGSYYVWTGGIIQRPMGGGPLKQGPAGSLQYRGTYYPGTANPDEALSVDVRPGEETGNIRIRVATEKTYTVRGAVVGMPSNPALKPTDIQIEKRDGSPPMFGGTGMSIDPDGTFTFRQLSPGEYTLTASADETKTSENHEEYHQQVNEGFAIAQIIDSNVRADIQIGRGGQIHGKIQGMADVPGFPSARWQITLESTGINEYFPADIDPSGRFNIRDFPPGEYTFSMSLENREPKVKSAYIKQAICSGQDYATRPLEITVDSSLDCDVTVAADTGVVGGEVTDGDKPQAELVVVLIPESRELRRIPRYTLVAITDAAGQYKIAGAPPGNYFLFATPKNDNHSYFALDFADRNSGKGESITIDPLSTQIVNLQALK